MVGEAVFVGFCCFEDDVLRVQDGIVRDVDCRSACASQPLRRSPKGGGMKEEGALTWSDPVIVEDLACFLGGDVAFCLNLK